MKFNIAAAAVAVGLGFALVMGMVGILNMNIDGYGKPFIDVMVSIYPGYKGTGTSADLLIGCFYAATDGIIAGGGLALLYNITSSIGKKK